MKGRNSCYGRMETSIDEVMVAVLFVIIRKWSEVLRRQMLWRGCTDKRLF